MSDRINKTSIYSVVFLDIIDYSKKPDSQQIEIKNQFNQLINLALKDVAQNDRIILDTGDGAAIAFTGSPEEALFTAMTIRDAILKNNTENSTPLLVRFGINLGPVRVVSDINGRPNIIGDGINVAQRVMSFAKPNQILVSRTYYEIISRLTQEISEMFDYSGIKQDKHVREHEVYSVRLAKEESSPIVEPPLVDAAAKAGLQSVLTQMPAYFSTQLSKFIPSGISLQWRYALLALAAVIALFALVKCVNQPDTLSQQKPLANAPTLMPPKGASETKTPVANEAVQKATSKAATGAALLPNENLVNQDSAKLNGAIPANEASDLEKSKVEQKNMVKKTKKKQKKNNQNTDEFSSNSPAHSSSEAFGTNLPAAKPAEPAKDHATQKPAHQPVKKAITQEEKPCTIGERALNVCR